MKIDENEKVWLNGKLVARRDAKVSLLSPTAQFGANVFEGVRCYWNEKSQNFFGFRLNEHSSRLRRSIKLLAIDVEWEDKTMVEALTAVAEANHFRGDIAARVIAFVDGYGSWFSEGPGGVLVSAIPKGRHLTLGVPGIRCCISSWRRIDDNTMSPRIKAGANYINSRMAQLEAKNNGYDSTLFLNNQGKLAEGPGSCVFIVKNGVLVTPPLTASVLESITRETVMELARDELGLRVEERDIDRTEIYMADEAFICGSAVEVVPIIQIDRFSLSGGKAGVVTSRLLKLYLSCVRGEVEKYRHWITKLV